MIVATTYVIKNLGKKRVQETLIIICDEAQHRPNIPLLRRPIISYNTYLQYYAIASES